MFFVYVLKSLKDHTTYTGYCEDLEKRVKDHNQGKTKSTKHKIPLKLVYYEAYITKTLARKRELELKKNSAAKEQIFRRIFE